MKRNLFNILGLVLLSFSVIALCYFTQREAFLNIMQLSLLGWIGSLLIIQNLEKNKYKYFIGAGIILKIALLFSIPQFSDDFYRFIWDGFLVAQGENPYLLTPTNYSEVNQLSSFQLLLLEQMNSPNYFAVYLPLNQLIFGFVSFIGRDNLLFNLIGIRLIFLVAESSFLFFLLRQKAINNWWILFFLNPFIIVETYGNLHFELLMVLLFAFGFIASQKSIFKGFFMGLGISLKPYILLLTPFALIKQKQQLKFPSLIVGLMVGFAIWWLFFLKIEGYQNMLQSILLFIKSFEFNASFFYVIRWVGFKTVGYDVIKTAGPILSFIVFSAFSIFLYLSSRRPKKALEFSLYAYTLYLLFATTVHPWYIIPLLFIGTLTRYVYPFVWAIVIWLSYKAYQTELVEESYFLLWIEYFIVIVIAIVEVYLRSKAKPIFLQNLILNPYTNRKQNAE